MNLNLTVLKENARKYKRLHNCSHSDALDLVARHIGADNWHELISLSKRQTRLGFKELDQVLGPLADDDLVLIAGRPSSGKTSFAVNCANNVASANLLPAIYFSMSQPEDHLRSWLIASQEKISVSDAAWATHPTVVLGSFSLTAKLAQSYHQVFVADTIGLTLDDIAKYCKSVIADRGGISLLVVDYLEVMGFAGDETHDPAARTIGINRNIDGLKQIAVEFKVPILVLANLHRPVVEGRDDRPMITDLIYPKIYEASDKAILMYRDIIYNEDANPTAAELTVITKTNPNIRVVDMKYDIDCQLFSGYG